MSDGMRKRDFVVDTRPWENCIWEDIGLPPPRVNRKISLGIHMKPFNTLPIMLKTFNGYYLINDPYRGRVGRILKRESKIHGSQPSS